MRALKSVKPPDKSEIAIEVEKLKALKNQLLIAMKEEEERTAVYGTGPPEPQVQTTSDAVVTKHNETAEKLPTDLNIKVHEKTKIVSQPASNDKVDKNIKKEKSKGFLSEQRETADHGLKVVEKDEKIIGTEKSADDKNAGGDTNIDNASSITVLPKLVKTDKTIANKPAEGKAEKVAEPSAEGAATTGAEKAKSDSNKGTESTAMKTNESASSVSKEASSDKIAEISAQKVAGSSADSSKSSAQAEQAKSPTSNNATCTSNGPAVLETSFSSTTSGGSSGGAAGGSGAEGGNKPHKKKKRPRNRKK